MKRLIVGSLFVTAMVFAHDAPQTSSPKMSAYAREGLATQSPPVHLAKYSKHKNNRTAEERNDRVVTDKNTINAFVPQGK